MPIELNELNLLIEHEKIYNKLSKIQLIVMDLDGTVLDQGEDSEEIDEIHNLCSKLEKYGIKTTIATGRTLTGSKDIIYKLIKKNSIPIITYNGSLVIHNQNYNTLNQNFINNKSIEKIIEKVKDYSDIKVLFYCFEDNIVTYSENVIGWTSLEKSSYEFNGQKVNWVDKIDDLLICNYSPSAILIDISKCETPVEIVNSCTNLENITVTSSGNRYIEIRPFNSDKGKALAKVTTYLEIDKNLTLAIGDNDNDVEMLDFAGVSISISNASEKAKKASDFISSRGAYEGVLEILRLINEFNRLKRKRT